MGARAAGILAAALLTGVVTPGARADRDHDRAWEAVQRGEIVPLARVLARVRRDLPGELLEVELEDEHGLLIYEVKVLGPGGRISEVLYDARSGEPLEPPSGGETQGR
jgi:uncharacterized membrane protein YkoI